MIKILLLFIIICTQVTQASAQILKGDSVPAVPVERMWSEFQNLHENLEIFRKRNKTANFFLITGIALESLGLCLGGNGLLTGDQKNSDKDFGKFLIYAGGGFLLIEFVLRIDNNKWLTLRKRLKH